MKRPPYTPECCCYLDTPEWRNHPSHSAGMTPDAVIDAKEGYAKYAAFEDNNPVYLFRNAVAV